MYLHASQLTAFYKTFWAEKLHDITLQVYFLLSYQAIATTRQNQLSNGEGGHFDEHDRLSLRRVVISNENAPLSIT